MSRMCTALFVSDEKQCQDPATSLNGLFCRFHSRQCQGLYKGYKRRNAQLDAIRATLPAYLTGSATPLANQKFADVKDETALTELHDHLFLRYQLLGRVIRARQLHHSRFYASNLDYGHQHFLDGLQNEKYIVLRALERLERRTAEVLHKKQQWFGWVRSLEDEEEAHRENEKKKVKREAALFQRHWKEVARRMKELRAREDAKRQAEYLEGAYQERMSQKQVDEDDEVLWDPIEDVIEDQRGNYMELIRHFLWIEREQPNAAEATEDKKAQEVQEAPLCLIQPPDEIAVRGPQTSSVPTPQEPSGLNARKEQPLMEVQPNGEPKQHLPENASSAALAKIPKDSKSKGKKSKKPEAPEGTPGQVKLETKSEVRQRLSEGMEYEHGGGWILRGTLGNSTETMWKTVPIPEYEIDKLLMEIAEIKQLLFCRLLLAHAALLPAALRASNVEELLQNPEVTESELRDLCLKMEQPGLQELRDACADLGRNDAESEVDEEEYERLVAKPKGQPMFPRLAGSVPKTWISKREKKLQKHREVTMELDSGASFVDFGSIDDEGQYRIKKIRVRVCGRYIYNYPSEKAMLRGGWLQFSIIAKGSSLFDAMSLCRNWDEFYELTILACFQYFPTSNWATWVGDRGRQQMLQLGFIPYFQNDQADRLTMRSQTGSRSYGMRRSHAIIETRSFVCAHIKRNDPTSRRLVQYLSMQTARLLLLVRDAKTGSILVKPPENELWLVREKSGVGRAARNEWNVIKQVGTQFFDEMDNHRKWHFGFKEYYDLVVWDLEAGQHFSHLYNNIQEMLIKAHRFCSGADFYGPAAHVLKTITREEASNRVRDIGPGEVVESIWDQIQDPRAKFVFSDNNDELQPGPPKYLLYNESDALEDAVLFPEESHTAENAMIQHQSMQAMHAFEHEGPSIEKFIFDLDTDEEVDGEAEDQHDDGGVRDDSDSADDNSTGTLDEYRDGNVRSAGQIQDLISRGGPHNMSDMMERMQALLKSKTGLRRGDEMSDEFEMFIDREKAFIFKESWHKADLEAGAQEKYAESSKMVKEMVRLESTGMLRTRSSISTWIQIMNWLEVDTHSHRRIYRDARQAYAMMAIFFPGLYDPESASNFTDSPLVKQADRSKSLPVRRSYHSNKYRPRQFWTEWDELLKVNSRRGFDLGKYPEEWNCAIRPIIARLYKEGVICNSYSYTSSGQAIGGKEDGRYDLYFDWRPSIADCTFPPGMEDPTKVEPLISRARRFASQYANARFAVLRLWSAPHFYPLMLGWNNRDNTSFTDGLGRTWEWKFIPKDMPYSEWSIHQQGRLRIKPYAKQFGDRVMVRRDSFLVMGENAEDLLRLAVATTFAITTRPWRLEVDLWKSFVNVDVKFLEDLDKSWLE